MTEKEIEEFFQKKEVIEYLKKNILLDVMVRECNYSVIGYDITATAYLGDEEIATEKGCP